ncbi:MAG: hypothetical protein MRZ79_06850 [Bacteroidia bacterium]|nr:hypothetical protein [Bacteroidia bacterium]
MEAELIAYIEDYLDGKSSKEELEKQAAQFEVEDLEKEIEWVRDSRLAIEMAGLREELKGIDFSATEEKKKIRSMKLWRPLMAIAAAFLLLLVVYLGIQPSENENQLYAQYEYKVPGLPMLMSQSENYLLYDALTYYGEENYAEAARRLTDIQTQFVDNDTLLFYLGASLQYEGRVEDARKPLEKLGQMPSSFGEQADWLLVLGSIKEDDIELAQKYLKPILENKDHAFHTQAMKLSQDVKDRK